MRINNASALHTMWCGATSSCNTVTCRCLADLKLILDVQLIADAACRRALAKHECSIILTESLCGPATALIILIKAADLACAARIGAFLNDSHWVREALSMVSPDVALCDILIGTGGFEVANTAAVGALLIHEARILVAFTLMRPPRTVRLHVKACFLARTACHRAVANHKLWVFVAAIICSPACTLEFKIFAVGGADAARDGTQAEHRLWILLALKILRPCNTTFVLVLAFIFANPA